MDRDIILQNDYNNGVPDANINPKGMGKLYDNRLFLGCWNI